MTDEELAEETVMAHAEKAIREQVPYFKFAELMFLEGLKEGRPKWHKVADGDLPKEYEYVLVYTDLGNYYIAERRNNYFMIKGFDSIPKSTIVAWCEISKF